jgi:hypothetical protein
MQAIMVNPLHYQEILDFLKMDGPKKIAAIKRLRSAAQDFSGESLHLREAKYAIERLQHELNLGNYPLATTEGAMIMCGPRIKSLTVNFGDGDVEVDVETMQLKILAQLPVIGIESCGQILELVQVIKAFSDGHKVGIIEKKEES